MAEQEEKPIRVVDRRMFTAEGELRPDFQPEDRAEPPPPAPESRPARGERPPPSPAGSETAGAEDAAGRAAPGEAGELKEPHTGFGSLVGWIATNAYAALGLLPDAGGRSHRDLTAARQMVDWLSVLEQKTRGNLSFEESDFLSRVLYELRLAFVEITRRPTK